MTNDELDRLLKSARIPERAPSYWDGFPFSVLRALRRADSAASAENSPRTATGWKWGLALATACVVVGLAYAFIRGHDPAPAPVDGAELKLYLREIEALFPHQLQAIVFDESGPRLVLSETADVPSSPAVVVRICATERCRSFVTFSGQQVRVNGEEFEILVDAQGDVIVVAGQVVWSSTGVRSAGIPYRIEARRLDGAG